jgi:hypothetical protein
MTDRILEIIQRNYDKFTGTNEAELHAAEEIAALFRHEQGRLDAIINYTSNPDRMVLTEFVAELTGMEVEEIVKKYKKYQKP